jgi:poly(3-hydroxybutyrate) depolymerase
MMSRAVARFRADPRRIFIAGFSAGAAMAAAMLAAYPAVFAAGAVAAGMPVGCARTQMAALLRMRRADGFRTRAGLADDVRAVTGTAARRKWPRLSIWQGERDRTVAPGNAELLAEQWSELHGLLDQPTRDETPAAGVRHRTWSRGDRPPAVEIFTLAGLGHGFPIDPGAPDGGRAGPWVVDAGLSGTRLMAAFWGIAPIKR